MIELDLARSLHRARQERPPRPLGWWDALFAALVVAALVLA